MTHHRFPGLRLPFPVLLVAFALFAACGKDGDGGNATPLQGNVDTPSWSVASDYDYSTSMTAVVAVGLPADGQAWEVDTADLLAAFVGDECVGLARPSGSLFFLYIVPPRAEGADGLVMLRYYSARLRNIFVADESFPFVGGGQQGTAAAPRSVAFVPAASRP